MLRNTRFTTSGLWIILCLLIANSLYGQESPYTVNWKKDGIIIGGIIAAEIGGVRYSNKQPALTLEEIQRLKPADVNSFDRDAIFNNSANARKLSDVFLLGSNALPLMLLANKQIRKDYKEVTIIGIEALAFTSILTTYTKAIAQRTRPFAYNPEIGIEQKMDIGARHSFFSGHTSVVSSASFFTAKVFSDYFPDSKWKTFVWGTAAIIPAATGYLRVKGGRHYPTDVMTGYAVGALVGILVPHLHKKKKSRKEQKVSFSTFTTGNQVGLVVSW